MSVLGQDTEVRDPAEVDLARRVRRVLEEEIDPIVAQHGGSVRLERLAGGVACVRFAGRCQGCRRIDATLRHGVEALLRRRVPEIETLCDVTDHARGENPYYRR